MRLGILGGVFNPPHVGHLICAQEALVQLDLEQVLLIPVGEAPHRAVEHDPGAEVRHALCERAASADERLAVSRVELERAGPSYTVDTLAHLRADRPEDELVLLLGGDEAATLGSWHEPEQVLELATVAAVERDGARRQEIAARLTGLRGAERVVFFDMPRIDVSSSLVRDRVARGLPVRYLVPDAVAELIEGRGLYRDPAAVAVR